MAQPPKKGTRQPRKLLRQPSAKPPAAQSTASEVQLEDPVSSTAAFPIVGIGASAGGLESFTHLLQEIPVTTGLAFVLVQHLDPTHESMLPALLSRVTRMPVQQVRDGMMVEPNKIYVSPPNVIMTISGLVLKLASRSQTRGLHMPIDHFFRSLAEEHGRRAIGIILSGAGSDGALGIAEIKDQGGITFVQDERTAKFPGMPHSAITNDGIDFVLPPAGIAQELTRVAQHPYVISSPSERDDEPSAEAPLSPHSSSPEGLDQVFGMLRAATGVDFTFYKQSTIRRRITRRMTLRKMDSLREYVQSLKEHREELDALYHDLLIKVTGFFRDPETFEMLKSEVFPAIMRDRPANKSVRIWVPGCASGEESYSIAICLFEYLGNKFTHTPIQVFATDIDEIALAKARTGRYIENIALDISPERLRRFFTKVDQSYQIINAIREVCTFAKHDLCRDPPFSSLDLISCRNVLIYFEPAMQKRVIPLFHYALNPSGFLTLGVSESIGPLSDLFTLADKKQKIFTKKATAVRSMIDFPFTKHRGDDAATAAAGMRMEESLLKAVDVSKEADRVVLNLYAPAGVVINEQMDILQFRGDTSHYLRPAPGRASLNLLQMAREGLLVDLRSAIAQVKKTGGPVTRQGVQVVFEGQSLNVNIRVIPLTLPSPLIHHCVILFEEVASPVGREAKRGQRRGAPTRQAEYQLNRQLAQELEATKEYLHSIIDRYETANEELKSANEEILSSNEELQSTNEELETAKEELQSTNEELTTVNDELRQRNQEVDEANNDLNNLFSSANLPIIVLGSDLRIRRFTASAEKVLNVIPTDIGRPLGHLNLNIHIPDLEPLILEAIHSVSTREREVRDREGHWYTLRIRPYRTDDNRIDGALLLFIDIDSFKDIDRLTSLLEEVGIARHFAEGVVQTVREPLLILDHQLRVIKANPAFYQVFQASPAETEQRLIYTLGNGQWNIPELQRLLEDIIAQPSEFDNFEVTHDFPQLGERTMLLNARRIRRDEHKTDTILLGIDDITERRRAEKQIAAALREKEVLLREVYHRVKNNLQIVSSLLNLQADTVQDPHLRDLFQESQRRIQAMSLVHQKLYGAEDIARTNTRSYIQSLVDDVARMYDTEGRIAFGIDADGELDIDTAIPCGLILTELVSNAFKYAFPTGQRGNVSVTLRPEAEAGWILQVQDNGIGLPPEIDIAHSDSLGLNLVHDLASQLGGRVELDRSQGTTFTIHFIPVQRGKG